MIQTPGKFLKVFFVLLFLLGSSFSVLSSSRGISKVSIKTTGGEEVGLYEESHALVIGVSDYTQGWPRLNGVKEDVKEVRKALEDNGFKVKLVMDPDRTKLEKEIREFVVRFGRKENNRLLFYYAGHGYSQKLGYGGQMGYLVPRDAPNPNQDPMGFELSAISMQNIETYARNISSKHALFVFDSCFAGSIFNVTRAIPKAIELKTARPVRQFITSGSADQEVPDQSVFRIEFVRALNGDGDLNKDGYLTASELGQHLEAKVVEYRGDQQTPQYGKLNDPILNQGDFVFKLKERKKKPKKEETKVVNAQPKAAQEKYRPDEEAWELVKDSSDPEDFQFFLESFPDSGLSKVARLKLRMINKKEKKIKKEQKTAEIKPKKKRTEYWENTSLKQEWFRSDQNTKRGLLGSMAACNRLFFSGHGWRLPSRSDVFRSFDDLLGQGLIERGDSIWTMERHGHSQAWFYEVPKNLSDLNLDDAKNPKKGNKDFEKSYLCIRTDDFDFQKMRTEYNRLLSNESLLAHKAFIKNYSGENRANNEVAAIRKRIRNLKEKKDSLITWKNHVTGLVWQRKNKPVIKTFPQAVGYCAGLFYDSKRGWRLPTPNEWQDASKIREFRDRIKGRGYWTSEKTGFDTAKYFYGNQNTTFSGFVNLNQSVLCVHGSSSFDKDKMMSDFNKLRSNRSKLAHRAFIKNYKDEPEAQMQVDTIRTRLEMLSEDRSGDYLKVVKEAEDTLGCFLFGCEDPLILPDYQNNFHVKQYKRIKVYASKRPWLSTEITVKDRRKYTLFLVGTGETRGCNRPQCKIEPVTKNRLVLKFGESSIFMNPRFSYRDSVAEIKFFENIGEVKISYRDWRTWPPPQGWYQDNSGHILIDAFLFEKEKEKEFKNFLRAVKRLNPDDENIQKVQL